MANLNDLIESLDDVTLIALSKLFDGKKVKEKAREAKFRIAPGEFDVDATFHMEGKVTLGEPEEYVPTAHLPTNLLMALFLQRLGVSERQQAVEILTEVMTEVLQLKEANKEPKGKGMSLLKGYKAELDAVETAVESFKTRLPRKTRSGKTNLSVGLERMIRVGSTNRDGDIWAEDLGSE